MNQKRKALTVEEERAEITRGQQLQRNKFIAQKRRVFESFLERPKTMLEVEAETGIMRSNICYYVRDFLLEDKIKRVITGICSITFMRAGRYTTDRSQWNYPTGKGGSHE
ncbi:hypothetical protein [Cecembia rubra]|uniref:Winged helix-turn-helix DNA-binding protein n=1 Tax=Cecembia rubra TaxID=1485585 RepID=A0A2P8E393_9BACT|nr:hypothetical protein [Cecembia rubra]PSL03877.1 hypothetical protein CLV48_106117 [Cecembia rubra]